MKKLNLSAVAKGIKSAVVKHSPEILTGIGIAGMITTTVLAVRATPRAITLLEGEGLYLDDDPPVIEVVKTAGPCYIPAMLTGTMSVVCLIGANSVNLRRNAALAAAYTLSESTLKEYQEKVIESIGPRKEQAIKDAIAKDKVDRDPVGNKEVIVTGKGDTLCYDAISGRYFKSDIDRLKKAENTLNRQMRDELCITLNEFYDEIGLPSIAVGEDLGWNIDRGYIDLHFSSQLAADGTPCLVVEYRVAPQYNYNL